MNLIEAMEEMKKGKKVRVKSWANHCYIHLVEDRVADWNGDHITWMHSYSNSEFELFEEKEELFLWAFKDSNNNWSLHNNLLSKEKVSSLLTDYSYLYKGAQKVFGPLKTEEESI